MFDRIDKGMWWDSGLTIVEGCTPMGCVACWAAAASHVREKSTVRAVASRHKDLTVMHPDGYPLFNGTVRTFENALDRPISKKRPTAYSVWNDLFHCHVPISTVTHAFDMFSKCDRHIFFVLTQRIHYARDFLTRYYSEQSIKPLRNVIIGTTVRTSTDIPRIKILSETPAAARILSLEPLRGPLMLTESFITGSVDGIIIGGPAGKCPGAMHPYWPETLICTARTFGIKIFFKGWGNWSPNKQPIPTTTGYVDKSGSVSIVDHGAAVPMFRVPRGTVDRTINGRTYNELPIAREGDAFWVRSIRGGANA